MDRSIVLILALFLFSVQSEDEEQCFASSACSSGLVCLNNTCTICNSSSECQEAISSQYICRYSVRAIFNNTKVCLHKRLIPLDGRDYIIFCVVFFFGALSAAGGIGGGGLFVPVLMIIGGFTTKDAIPLSNVIIFGAAIANFFQMLRRRHPIQDTPLIQYHLALLMQPTALLGTTVGVMLNKIFPDWAILGLLIATLALTAYRTGVKGVDLYRKEQKEEAFQHEEGLDSVDGIHAHPHEDIIDRNTNIHRLLQKKVIYGTFDEIHQFEKEHESDKKEIIFVPHEHDALIAWLTEEESIIPWGKLALHVAFLSMIVAHSAILTTGAQQKWLPLCSASWWVVWIILWPIVFFFTATIVSYFTWLVKKKKEYGNCDPNQSLWEFKSSCFIAIFSLFAGILSSLLGIGGGILLSPLMLDLGVIPDSAAATSSFMILWTSLAATIQFSIDSRLPYDYSIAYGVLGFFSSILGQYVVSLLVKKYNKRSAIVFCILAVIIVSAILLTVSGTKQIVEQLHAGIDLGFGSFCNRV